MAVETRSWGGQARQTRGTFDGGAFRLVAEALVKRLGVQPGRLRAGVLVVSIEEEWSSLVALGVLVCSESIMVAPSRFAALVEGAFVSGPDAVEVRLLADERKRRPLPASALREPLALWSGPGIDLGCERIIAYSDTFEIERRRSGGIPPPTAVPTERARHLGWPNDPWKWSNNFAELEVGLHFAGGREVLVTNLGDPDQGGGIVLSRFWRKSPKQTSSGCGPCRCLPLEGAPLR